jgi:hypothetical protein
VHWNLQPPYGAERTLEERMVAHRQGWEALRTRGLADAHQLNPDLAQMLDLIHRPAVELNAQLQAPEGKRAVVGCARGEYAALAELSALGLRLLLARTTALPTVVAETIRDRPMGSGTAVSVPAELLPEQQGLTGAEVERALTRGGVRSDDAQCFRAMLQGPKLGGGKFGAARLDRHGVRHRAEFVVTYYETAGGGYTIEQKRGADRTRWYTVAPAARPQLAQRLAYLLDSIRI